MFLFSLIDSCVKEILNISEFKILTGLTFGCVFLNLICIAYQFFEGTTEVPRSQKTIFLSGMKLLMTFWDVIVLLSHLVQKQPPEVFYKKAVLKSFAIFTRKHLCRNLFLIKLQAFRDSNTDIFLRILRNF